MWQGRELLPATVEYVWPDIITLLCMGETGSAISHPPYSTVSVRANSHTSTIRAVRHSKKGTETLRDLTTES